MIGPARIPPRAPSPAAGCDCVSFSRGETQPCHGCRRRTPTSLAPLGSTYGSTVSVLAASQRLHGRVHAGASTEAACPQRRDARHGCLRWPQPQMSPVRQKEEEISALRARGDVPRGSHVRLGCRSAVSVLVGPRRAATHLISRRLLAPVCGVGAELHRRTAAKRPLLPPGGGNFLSV